jgi:hypothetical protein
MSGVSATSPRRPLRLLYGPTYGRAAASLPRRCRASSAGPSQRIALETLVPEPFRRLAAPKDLFNGIRHTAAVKSPTSAGLRCLSPDYEGSRTQQHFQRLKFGAGVAAYVLWRRGDLFR